MGTTLTAACGRGAGNRPGQRPQNGAVDSLLLPSSPQVCLAASGVWGTGVVLVDPGCALKEERLFWAHTHRATASPGEPCHLTLHHPRQWTSLVLVSACP